MKRTSSYMPNIILKNLLNDKFSKSNKKNIILIDFTLKKTENNYLLIIASSIFLKIDLSPPLHFFA